MRKKGPDMSDCPIVQAVYDHLWRDASDLVARGEVRIDPYLQQPDSDPRRGTTLLLRPSSEVLDQLQELIDELRAGEPDQYFYPRSDLHVTLLTLERAAAAFEPQACHVDEYERLFTRLFPETRPFVISLHGISATTEAVLAQGHVPGDALNMLRNDLRREMAGLGLATGLDDRYYIVTAHVTFMRFRAPLRDPARFFARLALARGRNFGAWTVDRIEFVMNDWYMSQPNMWVLADYRLAD
jgi:2'-5' RNA ligase